jgi:hypothetical protein
MRSSTIAFVVGLIAAPAAVVFAPQGVAAELFPVVDNTLTASTFGNRGFEPAPMVSPAVGVSHVDLLAGAGRASAAGPVAGTPFSAGPSSVFAEGDNQGAQADRVTVANGVDGATPNLGK